MARDLFIRPETVTLSLPGGEWLKVKRRLTAGEFRSFVNRAAADAPPPCPNCGHEVRGPLFDPLKYNLEQMLAYLLDWSFTMDGQKVDIAGQPIETVQAALDLLDPDVYGEVRRAIDAHVTAQDAARAQEKNVQDGGTELPQTLPSLSAAAGVMNGSGT